MEKSTKKATAKTSKNKVAKKTPSKVKETKSKAKKIATALTKNDVLAEKDIIKNQRLSRITKDTKVVVVTGCTSGLGQEFTKQMAERGHLIIGVGRKPTLCREVRNEILADIPQANLHFCIADLSIMAQVKILADEIKNKIAQFGINRIDVLMLNAGVISQNCELTYENNEYQWATNYLSGFLLTHLLQSYIDKSESFRLITVTNKKASKKGKIIWNNIFHINATNADKIYNQTKIADLMFALEYDHKYADNDKIRAYCYDPGNVATEIGLKETSGIKRYKYSRLFKKAKTIKEGVSTAVYLATTDNLPRNVVFYRDSLPVTPSDYVLQSANREGLWKTTAKRLNLD